MEVSFIREKTLDLFRLESLSQRVDALSPADQSFLFSHQKGFEGESWLDTLVKETIRKGIFYWPDYTFEYKGFNQIDSLLLAGDNLFLIEVKNYSSPITFENGKWFLKDERLAKDFFVQMTETHDKLEAALKDKFPHLNIRPILLFVNEDIYPVINDQTPYPYLLRHQIRPWLTKLNQGFSQPASYNIHLLEYLESFYTKATFPIIYHQEDDYEFIQPGMICPICGDLYVGETYRHFYCPHDHYEFKGQAILRTAKEYAVIHRNEDLDRDAIWKFCGHLTNKKLVQDLLVRHFERLPGGKRTEFINPYRR